MFSFKYDKVLIHTDNILKINDVLVTTGVISSDELILALNVTLKKGKRVETGRHLEITNIFSADDVNPKEELVTNVKIFLKTPTKDALRNAVEQVLKTLEGLAIDSFIIWYPDQMTEEPTTRLLDIWTVLENYIAANKVKRLGIADLETKVFVALHKKVQVKPTIFHLNVKKCCVVPVDLQDFAREHDIQILTHNDPPDILPQEFCGEEFMDLHVDWIARYHSHVKYRGVLAKKGYLLSFVHN